MEFVKEVSGTQTVIFVLELMRWIRLAQCLHKSLEKCFHSIWAAQKFYSEISKKKFFKFRGYIRFIRDDEDVHVPAAAKEANVLELIA